MGISVSAKCSKSTPRGEFDEFDERSSALTMSSNISQIPIPRLSIPSESASTTSSASDDAQSTAVKKEYERTGEVDEKEAEIETCDWKLQTLNADQASLSWACDVYSKESDQMGMGWASQIDGEHLGCFGNRDTKKLKITNYSPMPENNSIKAFPNNFIVESIPTRPRGERNIILQNKEDIRYAKKPKIGSYCHLMKSIMQTHKEDSSSTGRTDMRNQFDWGNSQHANPLIELEEVSHEQRMGLYQANDFVKGTLQGKTHQISGQLVHPQGNKRITVEEPNAPRRLVTLINFESLNKYYQTATESQVAKCLHNSIFTQWCGEVQSSREETVCHETSKTLHDSAKSQAMDPEIQGRAKVVLNKTGSQTVPTGGDSEKKKSKREIMLEYSKTVAAANLVRERKGILKGRRKSTSKRISTLDEEIAKILQNYETGIQRTTSSFPP